MISVGKGTLKIKPLKADLLKDMEFFGKMDPFCQIQVGSQSQKTRDHTDAGQHPSWNDVLTFNRSDENQIGIEVWDHNKLRKTELIGSTTVPISHILSKPQSTETYQLNQKGKSQGQITIQFDWQPDIVPQQQPVQTQQQQQLHSQYVKHFQNQNFQKH